MEQRQVRLGDVLDDYCTRERRVTNHAVVALVGSEVKLTRCTTCDTEHPYKAAKVPPRRQTKLVAAPSTAPPEGQTPAATQVTEARSVADNGTPLAPTPVAPTPASPAAASPAAAAAPAEVAPPPEAAAAPMELRIHSVRRPLIRATLERPEGAPPPARQAPVFTIREGQGNGNGNGNERGGRPARKGRGGGRPGGEPNGNRIEGHQGQSARPSSGKNGAKSSRARGSGGRPDRPERANRQPRSRGKGRSN